MLESFAIFIPRKIAINTLESIVAMPAPTTSRPSGRITNINIGSSTILIIPPTEIPRPASFECPTLRRRLANTPVNIVGIPPTTTTHVK